MKKKRYDMFICNIIIMWFILNDFVVSCTIILISKLPFNWYTKSNYKLTISYGDKIRQK